jgi:O-antigen/teichoic acid export membrane protein
LFRASLTGASALVVRGTSTVVGLASIPFIASYLGVERLGMWLMLTTILGWAAYGDFGVALSLTNALAGADGRQDAAEASELTSSAYFLLAILAAAVGVVFGFAYPHISWARVFNVSTAEAQLEAGPAMLAGMVYVVLRLFLSVSGQIYAALQEGYIYLWWTLIGTVSSLVGLVIAIFLRAPLPTLVGVYFGGLLVGDLLATIYLLVWRHQYLRPTIQSFRWHRVRHLLSRGTAFWLASVSAVLFLQMDLVLVDQLFGAASAATYGTALKLVTLIGAVHTAFIHPLWPSYSEALASGDVGWIQRTFTGSIRFSLLWAVPVSIAYLALGTSTVSALVHSQVQTVGIGLILVLLLSELINVVARCISTLLNGLGTLRSQIAFVPIGAIVNLGLSLIFARIVGPAGVALATAVCLLVFWVGVMGFDARTQVARLSRRLVLQT